MDTLKTWFLITVFAILPGLALMFGVPYAMWYFTPRCVQYQQVSHLVEQDVIENLFYAVVVPAHTETEMVCVKTVYHPPKDNSLKE